MCPSGTSDGSGPRHMGDPARASYRDLAKASGRARSPKTCLCRRANAICTCRSLWPNTPTFTQAAARQNMGTILRGATTLAANWLHIPDRLQRARVTVVVSGTDIHRPNGQTKAPDAEMPSFGPSNALISNLKWVRLSAGQRLGQPITVRQADEMIFGYVLLNDWSARDIQGWEYQPLGPFQGKAFGTTISPWIVTAAALEAFRAPTPRA